MDISTIRHKQFLMLLWQNRLFESQKLTLTDGTPIEIVSSGTQNNSDPEIPEFSHACIRFPQTNVVLHGSVKIDTHSSHYRQSNTINNPGHSSVILHVVAEQDIMLFRADRAIPTLRLEASAALTEHYDLIRRGNLCVDYLTEMEQIHRDQLLTRIMSDRLDRKSGEIMRILESVNGDWNETAYISFMRGFGYRQTKETFETLARSLPYRFIRLHSNSQMTLEALLLGQAGYLDTPRVDDYTRQLQAEYANLRRQYALRPGILNWRSGSVRPTSMPSLSIVRIAAILAREDNFLKRTLEAKSELEYHAMFDVPTSKYWHEHYAPGLETGKASIGTTTQRSELLILNFVIPFLVAYATYRSDESLKEKAIDLYETLPTENNRHTRHWSSRGYHVENAFFSQALIQLSTAYCDYGLCGGCPLGAVQLLEVHRREHK